MNWQETESEIGSLAAKITEKPDMIIGIVRGGLVPSRILAKLLNVKDMYALTVKKEGSERHVKSRIDENLSGKTVLLVEDALESGKSLVIAKQYVESLGATVKTAALYSLPISEITPDYCLSVKDEVPLFPWD